MLTAKQFQYLSALVSSHAGYRIRSQQKHEIDKWFSLQLEQGRLDSVDQFIAALEHQPSDHSQLWDELLSQITNNESYFFRDAGQFNLLRYLLLPEMIKKNRHSRQLRIWSAGCSRGEEPLSIAILLSELLPDFEDWDIRVIATDISRRVLEKAALGVFRQWSLRNVNDQFVQRYFRQHQQGFKVREDILQMVDYNYFNLVESNYAAFRQGHGHMDMIVCRNVFLYFDAENIQQVVASFADLLEDNGILITGHTELIGHDFELLSREIYPESMVYRRGTAKSIQTSVLWPALVSRPLPERKTSVPVMRTSKPTEPDTSATFDDNVFDLLRKHYEQQEYQKILELADHHAKKFGNDVQALLILAESQASVAQYEEARQTIKKVLGLNEFSHLAYYLFAHLQELGDDVAAAIASLEKSIYLQNDFVPAYLELAALLERSERFGRARQLREGALKLLQRLPREQNVQPYPDMTAGDLADYIARLVSDDKDQLIA